MKSSSPIFSATRLARGGHDLHQADCPGRGNRIVHEDAFLVDQPGHEKRIQPSLSCFLLNAEPGRQGIEQVQESLRVRVSPVNPILEAGGEEPFPSRDPQSLQVVAGQAVCLYPILLRHPLTPPSVPQPVQPRNRILEKPGFQEHRQSRIRELLKGLRVLRVVFLCLDTLHLRGQ